MKIKTRQFKEIVITGNNDERQSVLDKLTSDGYTIIRFGPRIRKNGWSFDIEQFQVKAIKSLTKFKISKQL